METKKPLILINNEGKKPVYRALVQSPVKLSYPDLGLGTFNYKEEAIRSAISDLIGQQITDGTVNVLNNHEVGSEYDFATITNAGYCPNYGGYVDFEVFKENYHSQLEDIYNRAKEGVIINKGLSTEAVPLDVTKTGENEFDINKMKYMGVKWVKNPRDPNTRICNIMLNAIPEKVRGEIMTPDPKDAMVDKVLYDDLKERYEGIKGELKTKEDEIKDLKGKMAKGKDAMDNLKKKLEGQIDDLKKKMKPYLDWQTSQKTELVNSIVEKFPDAEQDEARTKYEAMDVETLQMTAKLLTNAKPGERRGAGGSQQHNTTGDKYTDKEFAQDYMEAYGSYPEGYNPETGRIE